MNMENLLIKSAAIAEEDEKINKEEASEENKEGGDYTCWDKKTKKLPIIRSERQEVVPDNPTTPLINHWLVSGPDHCDDCKDPNVKSLGLQGLDVMTDIQTMFKPAHWLLTIALHSAPALALNFT
ncbi:hypothetical protein FQN57_004324 [Myotisia sp. PD_48]|nr:hypothetical protein FQN57_004324 [Myotisia sp. PD_48]